MRARLLWQQGRRDDSAQAHAIAVAILQQAIAAAEARLPDASPEDCARLEEEIRDYRDALPGPDQTLPFPLVRPRKRPGRRRSSPVRLGSAVIPWRGSTAPQRLQVAGVRFRSMRPQTGQKRTT